MGDYKSSSFFVSYPSLLLLKNLSFALTPGEGLLVCLRLLLISDVHALIFFFRCADFGGGWPTLSAEEIEVLENLVNASLGSEDLKLSDELLRDYKLAPPLKTKGIQESHIGVLGADIVSSAFQVLEAISIGEEDQADMVNLNIVIAKRSVARSVPVPHAASSSSSQGDRSGQTSQKPRPPQP